MDVSTEKRSRVRKIFSPLRLECAKRLTVKDKAKAGSVKQISLADRKALADRIQRGLDELTERRGKVSYGQIAERSGGLITEGAITNLLSKSVGNPTLLTLYGLARALEIDPLELFTSALGIVEPEGFRESPFWEIYERYQDIVDNAALWPLADSMLTGILNTVRTWPKKADDR